MDAALHSGDFDAVNLADDELSGVADCGGAREVRDFCVRNAGGSGEFIGESAEAGTEDERDFWTELAFFLNEAGGRFSADQLRVCFRRGRTFCRGPHVRIPTMQPDIRWAMLA